jgi:hypothetical protein
MPAVPFLDTHGIGVELLVEHIERCDGLDNHGINLVGREAQLVSRQGMGKTKSGRGLLRGEQVGKERGQVFANCTEYILGGRV